MSDDPRLHDGDAELPDREWHPVEESAAVLPNVDEPPRSGAFVEHDELILTDDEIAAGNMLGEEIDTEDDADNGMSLIEGPPR